MHLSRNVFIGPIEAIKVFIFGVVGQNGVMDLVEYVAVVPVTDSFYVLFPAQCKNYCNLKIAVSVN